MSFFSPEDNSNVEKPSPETDGFYDKKEPNISEHDKFYDKVSPPIPEHDKFYDKVEETPKEGVVTAYDNGDSETNLESEEKKGFQNNRESSEKLSNTTSLNEWVQARARLIETERFMEVWTTLNNRLNAANEAVNIGVDLEKILGPNFREQIAIGVLIEALGVKLNPEDQDGALNSVITEITTATLDEERGVQGEKFTMGLTSPGGVVDFFNRLDGRSLPIRYKR